MEDPSAATREIPHRQAASAGPGPIGAQRIVLAVAVVAGTVLRIWNLGGPTATYDESVSGTYSHLPFTRIPRALASDDAHPPLDYLIRHFFGAMGDTFALRLPSVVFGILTVAVVVWWMWRRGWFGVAMVTLTAVSPFQILYAHTARMYALAILCGTIAAALSERWVRRGESRSRWLMGLALLVGLFDLASFLLLAGGLFLVAGRRRDREAWRWRATVVGALAIWAAVWGVAFVGQASGNRVSWIARTNVSGVLNALNGLMSFYPVTGVLVLAGVVVGAVGLRRHHPALAQVFAAAFVAPFVVACLIGIWSPFLIARTLAPIGWGVPLALAALIDLARRRSALMGTLAAAAVLLVLVRSLPVALTFEEDTAAGVAAVAADVAPGDAVVVSPKWLSPLVIWNDAAPRQPVVPGAVARLADGGFAYVKPGARFDGRIWILASDVYPVHPSGVTRCPGQTPVGQDYTFTCYQLPGVSSPRPPQVGVTPPG